MGDAVLVLTAADDPTADAVITELDARGARVARLDTGDFPTRLRLSARNPVDGSDGWTGHLRADNGATVDLTEVGSVYYRRPTRFRFPGGMSDGDAVLAAAEARHGFGGVIASLDAMWINNPVNAAAEYKPLQLQVAARVGLTVPRTLITNSHEELAAFAEEIGGPVVCKAFSAVMLEDADGLKITYTTPVDPAEIDPQQLATTAHLVQEQVPKAYEVRVTMVGQRPYAVAIHADSVAGRIDWRSDYPALRYQPTDVPAELVTGMARYLDRFGLAFGAFDFAVTPAGEWIMFECNPAGQWLWLQEEAGVPIAAALADILTTGGGR